MGEPGERLAGIKLLGRSCRRWQLKVCSWIYEENCTSACSDGFVIHVETRSPPVFVDWFSARTSFYHRTVGFNESLSEVDAAAGSTPARELWPVCHAVSCLSQGQSSALLGRVSSKATAVSVCSRVAQPHRAGDRSLWHVKAVCGAG